MRVFRVLLTIVVSISMLAMPVYAKDNDDTYPELDSIFVEKSTARPGDKIIVSADAFDDSGIRKITATFTHNSSDASYTVDLYRNKKLEASGEYSGQISIKQNQPLGIYTLSRVLVRDINDNLFRYRADGKNNEAGSFSFDSDLSFRVLEPARVGDPISCKITGKTRN